MYKGHLMVNFVILTRNIYQELCACSLWMLIRQVPNNFCNDNQNQTTTNGYKGFLDHVGS